MLWYVFCNGSVTGGMPVPVGTAVHHFQPESITTIGWMTIKLKISAYMSMVPR